MVAFGRAAACARLTLRHTRRQAICGFCHLPIIIRCIHPVCAPPKPLPIHCRAWSRFSFRPGRCALSLPIPRRCAMVVKLFPVVPGKMTRGHDVGLGRYFYYYGYCFRSRGTGRHGSTASEEHPAEEALSISLSSRCS